MELSEYILEKVFILNVVLVVTLIAVSWKNDLTALWYNGIITIKIDRIFIVLDGERIQVSFKNMR